MFIFAVPAYVTEVVTIDNEVFLGASSFLETNYR